MNEHRIRLRGGWRCHALSADPSTARTITLPFQWDPGQRDPVRLVRQFGFPAIDRERERVSLRIAETPGLLAIRINDRALQPPTGLEPSALELGEDQLSPRNELVLDVDPVRASAEGSAGPGWGHIALIVRPRQWAPPGP
jgi:hypothetical protein